MDIVRLASGCAGLVPGDPDRRHEVPTEARWPAQAPAMTKFDLMDVDRVYFFAGSSVFAGASGFGLGAGL